jgi:hypothetical protein
VDQRKPALSTKIDLLNGTKASKEGVDFGSKVRRRQVVIGEGKVANIGNRRALWINSA